MGTERTIELAGRACVLRPLKTAGLLKLIEDYRRWKCKQYVTAIADLRDVLPAEQWQVEWSRALERGPFLPVTVEEVRQWATTSEGLPYSLSHQLSPEDAADFPIERLRELVYGELDKVGAALEAMRNDPDTKSNEDEG